MPAGRVWYGWITFGLILLLPGPRINRKAVPHMQDTPAIIPLFPLSVEVASAITRVQLLARPQGIELLYSVTQPLPGSNRGYETSISSTRLGTGAHPPARVFLIPQLLPPPPSWDVALSPQGLYSVVYERALGATYAVNLRDREQAEQEITSDYPFESFTRPHFVKGAQGPVQAITAISDEKSGVLFARGRGGREKLCDCDQAMVVKYLNDFLLFYKVIIPGRVRGNSIQPGKLRYVRLGSGLAPLGMPMEPLPGRVVFEFDVASHDGNLAVLATTEAGTILAQGSLKEPLRPAELEESKKGQLATSPTVLVTDSHVYVGILEGAQTRQARVLTGSTEIE